MKIHNEKIVARWDTIMNDLCLEHLTIKDQLSELSVQKKYYGVENGITVGWMLSEAEYWLSCYYEEGNCRYDDRLLGEYEYASWKSESGKLKRLVAALAKLDDCLIVEWDPEPEPQPEKQPEKEEEKTMNKFRKSYINSSTGEGTESAHEAMIWHRNGDTVQVNTYWNMPGKTGLHNVVHVHGAHVAKTDENREHCRQIAEDVEAYANGNVYRCPDCGEIIELPDDVGDKYRCPDCETVHDVDDLEQLSLYDYFEDCLDIKYLIDSDRVTVHSVKIMVACGGPNIYVDTESHNVELYWWGNRASYPIDYDTCNEIDEWAQEMFSL